MESATFDWLYDIFGRGFLNLLIPRMNINWFIYLAKVGTQETRNSRIIKHILMRGNTNGLNLFQMSKTIPGYDVTPWFYCEHSRRTQQCEIYSWVLLDNGIRGDGCGICVKADYNRYTKFDDKIQMMMIYIGHGYFDEWIPPEPNQIKMLMDSWDKFLDFALEKNILIRGYPLPLVLNY